MLFILDHVLTTLFGDCFDDFYKWYNYFSLKPLMVTNEHTIIPTCHQHLSSRPGHKNRPLIGGLFVPGGEVEIGISR